VSLLSGGGYTSYYCGVGSSAGVGKSFTRYYGDGYEGHVYIAAMDDGSSISDIKLEVTNDWNT